MEHQEDERPKSLNNVQCRMVLSMVNDVFSGKKIAANFTLDDDGRLVEAGTRKRIERRHPDSQTKKV